MAKKKTELEFWRTFISDLFLGTFKRFFLFSFLGVLVGILAFYMLNYPLIGKTGLFRPIRWIIALLSFCWFLSLGYINGLAFSFLHTAKKKLDELRNGVQNLLDLLMDKLLGHIPKASTSISVKELENYMDIVIKNVTKISKNEFSFLSFLGISARLMLRIILKCIKSVIRKQLIDRLTRNGEITISIQSIESQIRQELIDMVLGQYYGIIILYNYLLYCEFIIVFGLPFGLFFLFQIGFR